MKSMIAKPSPGPWTVEADYSPETGTEYTILAADGSIVTEVDGDGNAYADAPVLAAAWGLLEALKDAHAEILAWREWAEAKHGRGVGPEKPIVTSTVLRNAADAIATAEVRP